MVKPAARTSYDYSIFEVFWDHGSSVPVSAVLHIREWSGSAGACCSEKALFAIRLQISKFMSILGGATHP